MTESFKHLIVTRFNMGLYGPQSKARLEPNAWMAHRLRLFETFTLPSIAGQSCQNFTWLIAIDPQTPDAHVQALERLCQANIKLVVPKPDENVWLHDLPDGSYDVLTTRIDNDDAFHLDAVASLQATYRQECEKQPRPWVMVFPIGAILDLVERQGWLMEYWYNNCPTAVETRQEAEAVWRWRHNQIPEAVPRYYIKDKPYWLQVVHEQNLLNAIASNNPHRKIHQEMPMQLKYLTLFGIDPNRLPGA